jgi:hypothetical protein
MRNLFLVLLLSLGACNYGSIPTPVVMPSEPAPSPSQVLPTPSPVVSPLPEPSPSPSASPVTLTTINVSQAYNFTQSERDLLDQAVVMMHVVINGDCFKQRMLSSSMTETQDLSNQQVYEKILAGGTFWKDPDHVWDLQIALYYNWLSKTIGYVNSGDPTLYLNTKFYSDAIGVGSVLSHEYSHEEGFTHYGVLYTSVPYTINHVFELCAGATAPKTQSEMFFEDQM